MEGQSKGKLQRGNEEEGRQVLEFPKETSKGKPSANSKAIVYVAARQQLAIWSAASSAVTLSSDQGIDSVSTFQYAAK